MKPNKTKTPNQTNKQKNKPRRLEQFWKSMKKERKIFRIWVNSVAIARVRN